MKFNKLRVSTFLAILFHISGLIGILFTPYKEWFIHNTPFTLCLMAVLLLWNQPQKNGSFWLFIMIAFLTGMGTEMIGVHTGHLFGKYHYGSTMGSKFNEVPYLIGLNWVVVILCSAAIMVKLHAWFDAKMEMQGTKMPPLIAKFSFIVDGALLATCFDWIMEPVAMKIGFWQWQDSNIPLFNYACWFLISSFLLMVYRSFFFEKDNHFAVHLLIIQALFFLTLRTFLV